MANCCRISRCTCRLLRLPLARSHAAAKSGAALVIVLSFVVLLTFLIVALFTVAIGEQQLSISSSHQSEVDLFARGSVDSIIGDLRQEIAAGSIPTADALHPVFMPRHPAAMVPAQVGSDPALPNLVKRSCADTPFFSGNQYDAATYPPSNRAVAVSSEQASKNGRTVSRQRWNKSLLLPKDPAALTDDTSTSPHSAFIPPDWILVNGNATNPKTPDVTVVGRYAYAIYDEGGLLDINFAGHPLSLPTNPSGPAQMSAAQGNAISKNGSLACADLTQVGLTRLQADQVIGWRNYATAQPTGALPRLSFDNGPQFPAMERFNRALLTRPLGPLRTSNTSLYNNQSDHLFTSRQQLIHFLQRRVAINPSQRAKLQTALQYLGTFSRDYNQPSFTPDPLRPRVLGNAPAPAAMNAYRGNNDAQGQDDLVNPGLLQPRSANSYLHSDGSTAATGDPLLHRRFPLSRLSLLTRDGVADVHSDIYRYFGLTRDSPQQPWLYSHDCKPQLIARLQDLAKLATPRDPDLVELLKAAITVGSLGKGAATGGSAGACNYRHDVSADYQVIQILANLIDQYDEDGFPTRILLPDGTLFSGVENLPYFYRFRVGPIETRLPAPVGTGAWSPINNAPALNDEGRGVLCFFPELWNPHDQNSALGTPRPTAFRILIDAADQGQKPVDDSVTTAVRFVGNAGIDPSPTALLTTVPLNADTSELLFSVPNARLFREPTLMGRAGRPSGCQLRAGPQHLFRSLPGADSDGAIQDVTQPTPNNPNNSNPPGFLGAYLGSFPLRKLLGATLLSTGAVEARLAASSLMVRLQYQDDSGAWISYDQKLIPTQHFAATLTGGHPGSAGRGLLTGELNTWGQCSDPRTTRFGVAIGGPAEPPQLALLDEAASALKTSRPERSAGWSASESAAPAQGLNTIATLGAIGWAPTAYCFAPGAAPNTTRWPSGLLAQNRSDVCNDGYSNRPPMANHCFDPLFYTDPDGIARRAAAAYVLSGFSSNGAPTSAVSETGLPQVTATTYPAAAPTRLSQNRPLILNRAFRSVAELGYVFRDQPWKEIDFFTPESGDTALLDIFSARPDNTKDGVIAGKLNLNTRQIPVLKAVLTGAYRDEIAGTPDPGWQRYTLAPLSSQEAEKIAQALVLRTQDTDANRGPLRNLGELVGKFVPGYRSPGSHPGYQPQLPYDGLSADLNFDGTPTAAANVIARFRQAPVRALTDIGTVRVWNLFIDLVAQTGRYPAQTTDPAGFIVEAEKRLWVHLAIDRLTGTILDNQIEVVRE